jgi:hypothetical protein
MNPSLVEPTIKYVLNNQLVTIKQSNERKKNILFNLFLFILLISIVGITLKLKYKGKKDILSNLRKYQTMKSQPLTNIPIN